MFALRSGGRRIPRVGRGSASGGSRSAFRPFGAFRSVGPLRPIGTLGPLASFRLGVDEVALFRVTAALLLREEVADFRLALGTGLTSVLGRRREVIATTAGRSVTEDRKFLDNLVILVIF